MRFGIFYEHQLPRPWEEGAERRLISDALEQVELADRLGIDSVWEVEHHFLEEYSHSSASEVFLAAASQRTQRIRLGFGIVAIPPGYQHPARVAEKVSMLDLVSGGRDKPVKSVLIRIAGRRGKTDRRGRTHFTLRFRRDAVYRIVASRRNYRTGYALLRAGRGRLRAFVAGERGEARDEARTVDTR